MQHTLAAQALGTLLLLERARVQASIMALQGGASC